jgi:haloalkane dehalogenase
MRLAPLRRSVAAHESDDAIQELEPLMSTLSFEKLEVEVLGRRMAYVDVGQGSTLVFLHGNPTSSFLWRNIIRPLSGSYRCVAPDLIGMGDSEKLAESGRDAYTLATHQRYLDGLLEAVLPGVPVVLVVHDWGSALGFDWAKRHAGQVRGIAYMEAVVRPMAMSEWSAAGIFERMRSDAGEELVLEGNIFVEKILPKSILRQLADDEMAEYRRPFLEPGEGRRPTLTWPRQMPLDGFPAEVVDVVSAYAEWLSEAEVPKLFVNAEPGAILTGGMRDFCRTWPNQVEVTVPGIHFIQEDSPTEIAAALRSWLVQIL